MSILNHLEFQPIDDDFSDSMPQEHQHDSDEDIELSDEVDESKLNNYLDEVIDDIHNDPDWVTLDDESTD